MSIDRNSEALVAGVVTACRQDESTEQENKANEIQGDLNACCVLEFYRSAEMREHGTKDSYDGSLGFDRYDSAVCAPGDIKHHEILENVIPERDTIPGASDKKKYLRPYLAIKKQQKVTIYVRAEKSKAYEQTKKDLEKKGNKKSLNKFTIRFEPTDENLTLSAPTIQFDITDSSPKSLTVDCGDYIQKQASIKAILIKIDDSDVLETLVGELIVMVNNKKFNAVIQPIFVRSEDELLFPPGLKPDMAALNDIISNYVFNQALVDVFFNNDYDLPVQTRKKNGQEAAISKYINTNDDTVDYSHRHSFNTFMEEQYRTRVTATSPTEEQKIKDSENNRILSARKSNLIKKTKEYLEKLRSELKYDNTDSLIEALKYLNDNKITQTIKKSYEKITVFDIVKKEYEESESVKHLSSIKSDREIAFYIRIFFYSFIKNAPNTKLKGDALGYSAPGSGICHIFSDMTTTIEKDLSLKLIAHEMGHAFGLRHTFKDDGNNPDSYEYRNSDVKSKKELEKERDQLKKDIDKLKGKIEKLDKIEKKEADKIAKINKERGKRAKKNGEAAVLLEVTDSDYAKLESLHTYIKENIIKLLDDEIDTIKRYEGRFPSVSQLQDTFNNIKIIEDNFNYQISNESLYGKDTIYKWKQNNAGLSSININNDGTSSSVNQNRTQMQNEKTEKEESKEKIDKDIENYDDSVKVDVKKLSCVVDRSKTLDNLMDYRINKEEEKNSEFEYKTLRKWQWDIISQTRYANYNNVLKKMTK